MKIYPKGLHLRDSWPRFALLRRTTRLPANNPLSQGRRASDKNASDETNQNKTRPTTEKQKKNNKYKKQHEEQQLRSPPTERQRRLSPIAGRGNLLRNSPSKIPRPANDRPARPHFIRRQRGRVTKIRLLPFLLAARAWPSLSLFRSRWRYAAATVAFWISRGVARARFGGVVLVSYGRFEFSVGEIRVAQPPSGLLCHLRMLLIETKRLLFRIGGDLRRNPRIEVINSRNANFIKFDIKEHFWMNWSKNKLHFNVGLIRSVTITEYKHFFRMFHSSPFTDTIIFIAYSEMNGADMSLPK